MSGTHQYFQPEAVKENPPLHSVPNDQDKYLVPSVARFPATAEMPPSQRVSRWRTWPVLLVIGLLVAIIAGLVGGFIGKTIQSNRQYNSPSSNGAQPQSSACPSSTPTASKTNATVAAPVTSCPGINKIRERSNVTNTPYNIFCATDFVGLDIVSIYATTVSDCVEACVSINQYSSDVAKSCVGVVLVPSFVNRTLSMELVNKAGNCFLKYNITNYPPQRYDFEIVRLCLDGRCP